MFEVELCQLKFSESWQRCKACEELSELIEWYMKNESSTHPHTEKWISGCFSHEFLKLQIKPYSSYNRASHQLFKLSLQYIVLLLIHILLHIDFTHVRRGRESDMFLQMKTFPLCCL